eukprot:360921-Chlamydomonas_euryale.AAC.3
MPRPRPRTQPTGWPAVQSMAFWSLPGHGCFEALKVMGGKGGGKPGVAQGQAAEVERVSQAAEAAEHFAAMKLA